MHVLFLSPDTHIYNHQFIRGLKELGARVSAIGPAGKEKLSHAVKHLLDDYQSCPNVLDMTAMKAAAERLAKPSFDYIETIDEPLVDPAAELREHFTMPGMSLETAKLCRDKVAMKAFLRQYDVPCAMSESVASKDEAHAFAEKCGYPMIAKPLDGFGSRRSTS